MCRTLRTVPGVYSLSNSVTAIYLLPFCEAGEGRSQVHEGPAWVTLGDPEQCESVGDVRSSVEGMSRMVATDFGRKL